MSFGSRPVASSLVLLVVAVLAGSVGGMGAQERPSSVLRKRTGPPSRTVHLDITVTPKGGGQAVAGLGAKDFRVLDDGKPREVTSFEAVDADKQPVEAILLVDSVNAAYTLVAQERIQISKFLRANGGRLALPMTLAVLTDTGLKLQPSYTRDGNVLAASLEKYTIGIREIGRSTGADGAVERLDDSLKALRTLTVYDAGRPGRKILLWVSPGWPLLSGPGVNLSAQQEEAFFHEITWVSTQLRESQTTVYAVNPLGVGESVDAAFYYAQFVDPVKKPTEVNAGNLGLQVLAVQTGGLVLNSMDVAGLLQRCVGENLAYYRISFEPPPNERWDTYHSLKVEVAGPGLTAHTSSGYYAEP